jgi:hypothetical protein
MCLVAAVMWLMPIAGCTAPGATSTTSTGYQGSSEAARPSTSAVVTSSTTTTTAPEAAATTFSPASIAVQSVKRSGSEVEVLVVAPPETRFASGVTAPGVSCTIESAIGSGPVSYSITCPDAGPTLFSSTTFGDFDYGFETALR